jgi:excinuclease ABC subunit A
VSSTSIRIVNARQHNLKGITVDLPRRALIAITGPSGSGKSSLAFDTLYAEGQRRYIESLSTYAKQFLERMPKPLVDRLDGVPPSVAIEQRNPTVSSRSTVGTATEVYDHLRLLWARVGEQFCLVCGGRVRVDGPSRAADKVLAESSGRLQVAFPLPASMRGDHKLVLENLRALGFVRVQVDGTAFHLDELPADLDLHSSAEVLIIVDRLTTDATMRGRLVDAIELAFREGEGVALVLTEGPQATGHRPQTATPTPEARGPRPFRFTEFPSCSNCDTPAPTLTPALFSFNNPRGACPGCNGFGAVLEYDESLVIPDPRRSIAEGAIDPWTKPRYETRRKLLADTVKKLGGSVDVPWSKLKKSIHRELLYGRKGRYVGIFPFLKGLEEKRYKQYIRVFLRQYQLAKTCPVCLGTRLKPDALAVKIGGKNIAEVSALPLDQLGTWLHNVEWSPFQRQIAQMVFTQLDARISFLLDTGLGYLTLDRQTRTLSGGEAQRISLSNALGASLVDALYVLDEPSIGLHPRDIDRLLSLLTRLRDMGNTVVVVEHDLAAIKHADFMLEIGPGAGEHGGKVVYAGPPSGADDSLTGQYLSGRKRIGVPSVRRPAGPSWLKIRGARLHNLQGIDADVPLGVLTVVTGVSGSGKSTLVHDVLYRQLAARIRGDHGAKTHLGETVGEVTTLAGAELVEDVLLIDQEPIGRSPRSNPITYVKGFDEIRELYAAQTTSIQRGYTPSTFSFNLEGGRCEACEGAGAVQVEMVFLADVFVPCETCNGTRFKREVLDVKIKGHSIADVLQFTVEEALARFRHQKKLGAALHQLQQVGLGYLRLGQPATTLSGGEAQRLKIARELIAAGKRKGRKLYILDEPTTGLHLDDVRVLIQVLDKLVDAGNTVILIEHHLDVIKRADWIIDMGPEAGSGGGLVVAQGTPEEIVQVAASHTGRYLKEMLSEH